MTRRVDEIMQLIDDMGGDEYESLPGRNDFVVHMAAGSVAGICEHTAAFPLDVVKTRLHRLRPNQSHSYRGVVHAFRSMVHNEGARSLLRGFSAVVVGAGPAHAIYFASYEQSKVLLGIANDPAASPHLTAVAGIVATFSHEATMNPIEVVKQRMQMYGSRHRSAYCCLKNVIKSEGPIALYRSLPTQVIMSIPYQIVHLVTYEFLRLKINPSKEYNPISHLLAGAGAGSAAALITNPFDVTKTLLNTQEPVFQKQNMSGLSSAFKTVYQTSGWMGFTKGIVARIGIAAPGTAISWCVYEAFKHIFYDHDLGNSTRVC